MKIAPGCNRWGFPSHVFVKWQVNQQDEKCKTSNQHLQQTMLCDKLRVFVSHISPPISTLVDGWNNAVHWLVDLLGWHQNNNSGPQQLFCWVYLPEEEPENRQKTSLKTGSWWRWTFVICHVLILCLGLFLLQNALKLSKYWLWRDNNVAYTKLGCSIRIFANTEKGGSWQV